MAILRPTPEDVAELAPEQPVMVDTDAKDNHRAILEIERWCREHGLQRVQEQWLRTVRTADGQVLRRGVCFRPSEEWLASRQETLAAANAWRDASPLTRSSSDILRQD